MKRISKLLMVSTLAIAMVATPEAFAQNTRRSSTGTSSTTGSRSSATTATTPSTSTQSTTSRSSAATVSRSSSTATTPSTATQSRSTTTSGTSRSSSTATTSRSTATTPTTQTQSRSTTTSGTSRSSATTTAPSTDSQSRSAATSGTSRSSSTATTSRSTATTPTTQTQSRSAATSGTSRSSATGATTGQRSNSTTTSARSNANVSASKGLGTVTPTSQATGSRVQPVSNMNGTRNSAVRLEDHNVLRIPPRERERVLEYNKPAHFYAPQPHYFGYRVVSLPPKPRHMVFWGRTYYYYNNVYYRPWGTTYIVARPPFGVCIERNLADVMLSSIRFAYYHNVYYTYREIDSNYRTIDEQNRTIARNNAIIAQQNATMALNTNRAYSAYELANLLGLVQSYANAQVEYYYEDGVFFTVNKKGKYEIIVPPAGALVSELPDDYETITLNGVEYYKVDDTVYRLTLVDGTPFLEVLGQMTTAVTQRYGLNW